VRILLRLAVDIPLRCGPTLLRSGALASSLADVERRGRGARSRPCDWPVNQLDRRWRGRRGCVPGYPPMAVGRRGKVPPPAGHKGVVDGGLGPVLASFASEALLPARQVPIIGLTGGFSPRSSPFRSDHVELLLGDLDALPPIVVQAATMAVIDGVHRVEAFRRRGRPEIPAVLVDCSDAEALVIAVEANVRHGLPLTLAERRRAASALLGRFADRSDRWIAARTGLSHTTVASLRASVPGPAATRRVGLDGRSRPPARSGLRERIGAAASEHPAASTRELGRIVGASPSTVSSALKIVPARHAPAANHPSPLNVPSPTDRGGPQSEVVTWLDAATATGDLDELVQSVPIGRVYDVADECRRRAAWWARLAGELEDRARRGHRR
jgi:hypothetical protein